MIANHYVILTPGNWTKYIINLHYILPFNSYMGTANPGRCLIPASRKSADIGIDIACYVLLKI